MNNTISISIIHLRGLMYKEIKELSSVTDCELVKTEKQ